MGIRRVWEGGGAAPVRESAWQETRSELEGAPRIVEAVWVGEADVAAGGQVLGVAAPRLHPHDGRGDAGLSGHSEAAHAAGGPSGPVKAGELMPWSPRAKTTIEEIRDADGTGSLSTVQVPLGLQESLGNKGGHTWHRAPGRASLVQLVRGRVPASSMKRPS